MNNVYWSHSKSARYIKVDNAIFELLPYTVCHFNLKLDYTKSFNSKLYKYAYHCNDIVNIMTLKHNDLLRTSYLF